MDTYRLSRFVRAFLLLVGLILPAGQLASVGPVLAEPGANAGWEEMGAGSASGSGISDTADYSYLPSLDIGPDGVPVVAWNDDSGGDPEIYVRRWDGSAWVEMGNGSASGGGISNNGGGSYVPSLAIGPDSKPVVVWYDDSADEDNSEIYARSWDGSAWVEMGAGSASGGGISDTAGNSYDPSLAIGPDGMPVVAWYDNTGGDYEIYLRRWSGSVWEEIGVGSASGGGISNNTGSSFEPSLAIDSSNIPVVAWGDNSSGDFEIYVRRWNGSTWEETGTGSASGGGISNNTGESRYPSLIIGPDDAPVVAWQDKSSGEGEILVRRWSGSAWEEMGAGSAAGGGISNNPGKSYRPSLAIGPDGMTVAAWYDFSSGDWEIYARRWSGSAWEEMDAGSASGGGISDNTDSSFEPSLAIDSNNTPVVAWFDESGDDGEIFVRRYQTQPVCYALSLSHTGDGDDPTATPANSTGCPNGQYSAGQSIALTASPDAGWHVKSWTGTANDSSTSTSNTATMPAANHTVSVAYEEDSGMGYWVYFPLTLDVAASSSLRGGE